MVRYLTICIVTVTIVLGAAAAWDWREARRATHAVSTTASLSLAGPSFTNRNMANAYAAAIEAGGTPAYVRLEAEQRRYDVMVGPFVSSGEAEAAQRTLARRGLAETRVIVDDSLRRSTQAARWTWARSEFTPRIVAAAAPGMLTLVVETEEIPREVSADRVDATLLDVSVSPAKASGEYWWNAPQGTLLMKGMQVQPGPGDSVRLRLHIPREALSRVRMEQRRTYVDLAWPDPPWPQSGGPRTLHVKARPARPVEKQDDGEAVRDVIARFRKVQPFLLSAVDAPEPNVLAAVAGTLDGFPESLPIELRQAIGLARDATAAEFTGDRGAHARRAIALFESAAAPLDTRSGTH